MLAKIEEYLNLYRSDITKIDSKYSNKITHLSTDIIKIKEQLDIKINSTNPTYKSAVKSDKLIKGIYENNRLRNQSADKIYMPPDNSNKNINDDTINQMEKKHKSTSKLINKFDNPYNRNDNNKLDQPNKFTK